MPKYRKKPVVIDAEPTAQLVACSQNNWDALPQWFRDHYEAGNILIRPNGLDIETPEGTMAAELTDYVICGVAGEVYPCKPEIFDQTYERVD